MSDTTIIPAKRGFFALTKEPDGAGFTLRRMPIIAWRISSETLTPAAITPMAQLGRGYGVELPDGSIFYSRANAGTDGHDQQFPNAMSFGSWLAETIEGGE